MARALSVGQCGILTTIDTRILAILYEKKIFENVKTSLYSPGFISRTVWNTNDDKYSSFGHFYQKKNFRFWSFLDFGHFLNVETSVETFSHFSKMAQK